MNFDLHTHSTASDGSLSPVDLIAKAAYKGLSAIALTDHDTIAGLEAAGAEAARQGIRFIRGIEISISWEPGEFHILGLGLHNPLPDTFSHALSQLIVQREERNRLIIERMQEKGIAVQYEDITALAGGTVVGRMHFADFLRQKKIVKNNEQAFSQYLGKDGAVYVPKENLSFEQAVSLIHEAGALAVLAHPLSLYVSWGHLPNLVADLRDQGLDGIEAWHPMATKQACMRLERLGKDTGLCISAGSDFHGNSRPDRKLGITGGGRTIDESLISEDLLLRLNF
ncbi:MAG: PHP domain-containing protein [Spirochaetaceae bacterium]|jgi:predicted metal-dependent phosphoesterase TrpH|nr:PHP domain-containing protein [Spirochaetaceae bacterium]